MWATNGNWPGWPNCTEQQLESMIGSALKWLVDNDFITRPATRGGATLYFHVRHILADPRLSDAAPLDRFAEAFQFLGKYLLDPIIKIGSDIGADGNGKRLSGLLKLREKCQRVFDMESLVRLRDGVHSVFDDGNQHSRLYSRPCSRK